MPETALEVPPRGPVHPLSVLTIDLVPIDAAAAAALRERLVERGHRVRLRTPSTEPGGSTEPDLSLAVSGREPVDGSDVAALVMRLLPRGRGALRAPLVLVTELDPTSQALAALYDAGFDLVLGAGAQRDLERHLEGFARALLRPAGPPAASRGAETVSPGTDLALLAARREDQIARRRAASHWWSLGSLEPGPLRDAVLELAAGNAPVLVRGERGSGRRHVGRVLHEVARRHGSFVQVSAERLELGVQELEERLGALLASADGGTLCFTDLVALRADRARVLVESLTRAERTRLVVTAAPGARPPAALELPFAHVDVPPLRERVDFLPTLAARLADVTFEPRAMEALQAHYWPANLTELDAVLARAASRAAGGRVQLQHLPAAFALLLEERGEGAPRHSDRGRRSEPEWRITDEDAISAAAYERKLYLRAIAECKGSCIAAAKLLSVGKSTFYRKLHQHGIKIPGGGSRNGASRRRTEPSQLRSSGLRD